MLLLKREDIKKVLTMRETVECVKQAFRMVSEGSCEIPLRTNIQAPAHDGCFLFMPAYAAGIDAAALKVINLFPRNAQKGMPTSFAQVFLMDGTNGTISAVLDGDCITQMRTGAASGAAFDLLGRKDSRIGAVIGTGGQAPTQIEGMLAVRKLEEVRVFDLDAERTRTFAERMQRELAGYGARIVAAPTSDAAVENADLIVTVTPSTGPVFDAAKIKPGATLSCVGAYQPHMQELDAALLPRAAKIYFDSRSAVLAESGDILIPLAQGIITEADFTGELGDVIRGTVPGRESDDEIIVFETVGVAAQDLVTAQAVYRKAREAGAGVEW